MYWLDLKLSQMFVTPLVSFEQGSVKSSPTYRTYDSAFSLLDDKTERLEDDSVKAGLG